MAVINPDEISSILKENIQMQYLLLLVVVVKISKIYINR